MLLAITEIDPSDISHLYSSDLDEIAAINRSLARLDEEITAWDLYEAGMSLV